MDRGGSGGFCDGEDFIHGQISASGSAFTEAVGLKGLQDVQAGGIGFGVNGNALDLQFTQGTQDATGNGAAVGNKDFFSNMA